MWEEKHEKRAKISFMNLPGRCLKCFNTCKKMTLTIIMKIIACCMFVKMICNYQLRMSSFRGFYRCRNNAMIVYGNNFLFFNERTINKLLAFTNLFESWKNSKTIKIFHEKQEKNQTTFFLLRSSRSWWWGRKKIKRGKKSKKSRKNAIKNRLKRISLTEAANYVYFCW